MRWIVFTLIYLSLKLKKPIKIAKMSEFIHNLARGHMTSVCFLPSVVRHGRGKLLKRKVRPSYRHTYIHTYFIVTSQKGLFRNKCRYFHVPNLIPIYFDPNDISSRLIQTSNLISRTQFIFTMYSGLGCFKQVKINFSNLCIIFGTKEVQRLNWT